MAHGIASGLAKVQMGPIENHIVQDVMAKFPKQHKIEKLSSSSSSIYSPSTNKHSLTQSKEWQVTRET